MVTNEKEFQRALQNPDNFIVSDELQDILDVSGAEQEPTTADSFVCINDQFHLFTFKKVKRTQEGFFKFKGHAPSFPVAEYLKGAGFSLKLYDETFSLVESESVSFDNDGILTFTARRIINNEKVPV